MIGGNAYWIGNANCIGSGTRCSVGFAVDGGLVTAGHCGGTGATPTQPGGTVAGSSFPGNDYVWVRTAAGNTSRSWSTAIPTPSRPSAGEQQRHK